MKKWIIPLVFLWCSKVNAQTPIDTILHLNVGGIRQVVSLKSEDRSLPLLLYLHGGPGNAVAGYADRFTTELQKHFVIAHWDQRNSGRTLQLTIDTTQLHAHRLRDDAYIVVDELLRKFNHEKLYVAGHSWGTYLGFQLAKNHPEKLYAYFAVCPMIDQLESEQIALDLMLERARQSNNKKALTELSEVKIPFTNGEQLYLHRKWLQDYMGSKAKISRQQVVDWAEMWLNVFNEASEELLSSSMPVLNCPVYFLLGRKDVQTNSKVAEKYYQMLTAPKKGVYWFERSGHSLPTTEPEKFQQVMIRLKEPG